MNYRLAGHWFGLLLFFSAGTFFMSFFIAWLWPAAFPRRPEPGTAPALASLGLALICYLKFGVLAATRARRHQPPPGRP
jgi:hypothetical protein